MTFDPSTIQYNKQHFVNGEFRSDEEGTFDYIRPSDQKLLDKIPNASEKLVNETVELAHKAYKNHEWSLLKPRDRAKLLFKWADLIEKDVDYLSKVEAMNSTRLISETSQGDVYGTADTIRYFAEWADKIEGQTTASSPNVLSLTIKEPYGVVLGITPWNFPIVQVA